MEEAPRALSVVNVNRLVYKNSSLGQESFRRLQANRLHLLAFPPAGIAKPYEQRTRSADSPDQRIGPPALSGRGPMRVLRQVRIRYIERLVYKNTVSAQEGFRRLQAVRLRRAGVPPAGLA